MTNKSAVFDEDENVLRRKIETYLAKNHGRPITINEIATKVSSHWLSVEKVLDDMTDIGRAHYQKIGKIKAYTLNGIGVWQQKFKINDTTWLFFDTFLAPTGEPFIRIKETKNMQGKWEKFGEVMITPDKLGEVIDFLKTVQGGIEDYTKVKSKMIAKN